MATFRVVLHGNTLAGFDPDGVRKRLAALIRENEDRAAKLLSGQQTVVKAGVDQPTALRYCSALSEIGVSCSAEPEALDFEIAQRETPPPQEKRPDEKYCSDCGAVIKAKAEICPKCGVRQTPPPVMGQASTSSSSQTNQVLGAGSSDPRSRVGAALFAILLGWIGIHKFYLGQTGRGILYLLFFWTGIPLVVGIIEGIVYLSMSDAAFAAKYG